MLHACTYIVLINSSPALYMRFFNMLYLDGALHWNIWAYAPLNFFSERLCPFRIVLQFLLINLSLVWYCCTTCNHVCKKAFMLTADRFAAFIWHFISWQVYIHECSFYHEHAWGMIFWDCLSGDICNSHVLLKTAMHVMALLKMKNCRHLNLLSTWVSM